jgi:serine/threonine-protein kinase
LYVESSETMTVRDDVSDRAQARVGAVLKGKWRLDAVLGIGGMATVYAATHRNRSRVAIKMLHAEVAISQDVTARFLREGYVGNAVAHSGTVKVLDDDVTDDGAPFLVMEMLEGESLGARLDREGRLPAHEVALLADQLLDVMAAAHAAHIVHRDLKPDNVFLTNEGRVKVLDFGIARLRAAAHESSASTQVGSLLGTPAFMAPEQALGRWKEVDERTDIWAIGATLFTLLSGRFVHEAEAVQEQLVLAATNKAPPVSRLAPDTPPYLAAVVDRALGFSREERFPDARSMQAALRETASGVEFPVYPVSVPGASGPRVAAPSSPIVVTPASLPRHQSSPSFSEGATLAAPSTDMPAVSSGGGTFASVQAVARSAQEAAPAPRSRSLRAGAAALLALGLLAFGVFWLSRPPAGNPGVLVHPAAPPPSVASPAPAPAPTPSPVVPVVPGVTTSPPEVASATAAPAVSLVKPPPVAGKKPPKSTAKPPTLKHPPDKPENIFDNRH